MVQPYILRADIDGQLRARSEDYSVCGDRRARRTQVKDPARANGGPECYVKLAFTARAEGRLRSPDQRARLRAGLLGR